MQFSDSLAAAAAAASAAGGLRVSCDCSGPRGLEQVVGHQSDRLDAVGGAVILRLVEGRNDDALPCVRDAGSAHGKARDDHWKLRRVVDELPGNLLLFGRIDAHSLARNYMQSGHARSYK